MEGWGGRLEWFANNSHLPICPLLAISHHIFGSVLFSIWNDDSAWEEHLHKIHSQAWLFVTLKPREEMTLNSTGQESPEPLFSWWLSFAERQSLETWCCLCCKISSFYLFGLTAAYLRAQMVKNLSVMQETWVLSLGQKDALEKGMATHSSILAWRIPWTEEPGGQ